MNGEYFPCHQIIYSNIVFMVTYIPFIDVPEHSQFFQFSQCRQFYPKQHHAEYNLRLNIFLILVLILALFQWYGFVSVYLCIHFRHTS
jgi:hypothetical protein